MKVSAKKLLEKMVSAKILYKESAESVAYKFKYPYIFYYFSGRYIAYHLQDREVNDAIIYMSNRLYNEDYGNIIIFVCHFANNVNVIETILLNAYEILNNYSAFSFQKSYPFLEEIKTTVELIAPKYIGGNEEVVDNKDKKMEMLDEVGVNSSILKSIVANYLRYNICDYKIRARLCNKFGFSEKGSIASNRLLLEDLQF